MKRPLFNAESPLWQFLGLFGELLLLSLLWFVCSVPLITLGAATAALYDTAVHCLRNREEDIFSRYCRTLKNELVPAIPSSLLWEAVIVGLFFLFRLYTAKAGSSASAYTLAITFIVLQVFVLGVFCWVFPVLSRFTFDFASLQSTSVKLAFTSPLQTAALGFITAVSVWLCIRYIVPVMLLPALCVLLWSYMLEPVFAKYMK